MKRRKYLFLALDEGAWGRATFGLDIAHALHRRGDQAEFLANSVTAPLLRTSHFAVKEIPDHLVPLSQLFVETCVDAAQTRAIVLCDFSSCVGYLNDRGCDPGFLSGYGVRVIALDIWNGSDTGKQRDVFGRTAQPCSRRSTKLTGRLVPVPISRPTVSDAYCSLPPDTKLTRSRRVDCRRNLGLRDKEKAVLFCTAAWQHAVMCSAGQQLAVIVPELLWNSLKQVHPLVRLIHIGPSPLSGCSGDQRYVWITSTNPDNFEQILSSMDMVLSANISATSIGRAIAASVPVVVVQNSYMAASVEEVVAKSKSTISPGALNWIEKALPLYPFSMWPLGLYQFLKPVLLNNPYCSAIKVVELLEEETFIQACRSLLFDMHEKETMIEHQAAYADQVRQLPTATQLIDNYLQ